MCVYVIAETGSCHNGSLDTARELIWCASEAGADAAKFQYWSSASRLAERRHLADASVYAQYQVPTAWLSELADTCANAEIEFLCTVYLPEDIAVVNPYVQRFKISSFESGDAAFLEAHLPYQKPLVVSLGMGGHPYLPVPATYLHCVSGYPTPPEQLNLRRIASFGGFSDHSISLMSGALAVACGATMIEKHVRLRTTPMTNPDAPHALTPGELRHYIQNIRLAERMLGDGRDWIQPCEADNVRYKVTPGVS